MFEHRLVVLVVDHGAQRAVVLPLEGGPERQRQRLGRAEGRPIGVQQDVGRVAGHAAARCVLMEERKRRRLFAHRDFEKGVPEERLVESQLVEQLSERLARTVDALDEGPEQGSPSSQTMPLPEM